MTSARAQRNTSAQPGDRYGVTSRCLGNDHDISVAGSWRDVTLPLRKKKTKTYPLQTCYEHNMLSLLHAVCLKVLVFTLVTEWRLFNLSSLSGKLQVMGLQVKTTNFMDSVFWIFSVLFFVTFIDCKNVDKSP